jgi:hypothetical protein
MKTIDAKELANIRMNESKPMKVIDNGMIKDWVGIGWVTGDEATAEDIEKYPTVVREGLIGQVAWKGDRTLHAFRKYNLTDCFIRSLCGVDAKDEMKEDDKSLKKCKRCSRIWKTAF